MKRLIPASVLLIFVIVVYLINLNYITKTCDKTNNLLQSSVNEYKTKGTAIETTEKLSEFWSDTEKYLSIFVNHNHIDEIKLAISSLSVYSKDKNNILFMEFSNKVEVLLHQIIEETKITTHSIL